MKSQCLRDTTNFIKIKNHFNHFLTIFFLWCIFFSHKYTLTSHHIRLKSVVYLEFDFFGFWLTIICKKLWKSFIIMTWFKFKQRTPKNNTMWQQFWVPPPPPPPLWFFFPLFLIFFKKKKILNSKKRHPKKKKIERNF